ncbi:zinc finger protein 318 isoform X2 [Eublepharis macularius]|uniref:Zinc finger protein 318 isoform X2 n=1 Tax=Eublepharis macularius TaxID=481883 RepID=A0AA97KVI8_EUBMA|nr:zinc finger protein 318 isoform X2 [Eublepharis macularius]
MFRPSSSRSSLSSSSRSKESSSSGSRSSRSGASTRGRSPRRSRSPSPRGRRRRSPSSSRSSRRSPSPRRTSRVRSPSGGSRTRRGSEQRDGSLSRRRSPSRRSRSPSRRSRSPGRHSPSRHSESSVEQSLRITVGNDHYGIDTPERRRLSDRLGSPVDSSSDGDRDDLAEGPIFSRGLSRPQSLERYSSHEHSPPSPFSTRHDEDYRSRDVFLHQSNYSTNYEHLQDISREPDRDGELLRKSSYQSEERGREPKRPRYDREDRMLAVNIEHQSFLPGTRNYRKRSLSRSPSPTYLDEDFRELESARRKREEEELSRNSSRDLPDSDYVIPGLTNPVQSSEPRYLYRPDEAPAMPKKSILKKRVDDSSVQPEVFSSSSASVKELPLHSHPLPLPQRSSAAPFSSEVENFLKRFNKNAVAESTNKDSQASLHDWRPFSGIQQNTLPSEQNFGSFLRQKDYQESATGSADRQNDFLLPHERASQDGSGFSRILGMMADSTSAQEKRRRSFPDIEDEEKFLYGDDEDDSNINLPSTEKLTMSGKEPESQKSSSPSSPTQSVKPDPLEESRPEYEKIHDLLKTIGLDIGVAEIGKLAARTQERLHGKKPSRSPDRRSVVSRKLDSGEMRRSRSNTRSPESNQKRSLSPSGSFLPSKELSSTSELEHSKCKTLGHSNSGSTPERSVPPVSLIPSAPPSLPNLPPTPTPVPQYSVSRFSPFTATQLPQNYPTPTMAPPGYDAYGHYMAYAASGWPMYAPPRQSDPAIPDVHGLVSLSVPSNPTRPNLRVIETVSTGKGIPEIKRDESVLVQIPTTPTYSKLLPHFSQSSLRGTTERMSDEKNRASQKQKVIEEREKLKMEQEARQKKLHYLRTELDRLSKQQGEMLRKKRREKDGHKDPLLVEVNRLQENIVKEITQLQIETETAEKKQSELDKVAQILGINVFEKSRKPSAESKDSTEKNKSENAKSQEKTSSSNKESKPSNDKPRGRSPKPTESCLQLSKQHFQSGNIYDYYDTGNHWCKDCNTICGTMFDFFTHMHNKKHRQTLDPYNRPWASKTQSESKQDPMKRIDKIPLPAKGSEFLIPVTGYYCQLCHEFFGDQISAEQHVKSHPHNEKYKKHVDENPLYEERRNLDRQAGLSVIQETERRLKRKQCEKPKEDRDENNAKVARKEESKPTKELGEESNENEISQRKEDSNGQKFGIKLKLKKDDKEVEKKEGKKEESQKESRQSSFGKFSWRKTEKDDKNQCKDVPSPKEECMEEGKDKDKESKSHSGKSNSKPIAIKLSGKTVIPHTSPWTPVVSASSQAKIRPNLPVPVMVLRKSTTTTVSKPAPLNTFLSIKSSGATTKPLPVVKEGNPELVLPPDIISKAFGGEVVVLKGSQENVNLPEQAETQVQEAESVTKAVEHAKVLENVKASMEKVQEQAMLVAKAQAKARELAVIAKEQELARLPKMHEQPHMFERPHRRPPLLPLPPRPPVSLLPPRRSPLLFPPPPLLPPKQTPLILADDMAPGVSEDDKNILAMPMCPRPLPPPTIFKDHVKKMEKKNTCLAAGNAKDLYDIFYNNSGRSPADNKLASSVASDKGKLSPVEKERSTEMLTDSKPNIHSSIQETLQNVDNSSDVSKIPVYEGTPENEAVKSEKVWAASKENIETETYVEEESQNILSDSQITSTYIETAKSNVLQSSPSLSLQNKQEIRTIASAERSKESLEFTRAELAIQILNTSFLPADKVNKKPAEFESAELAMQLSEDKAPLEEVNKNASELHTAAVISSDNELAILSSEEKALSLQDVSKKLLEFKTAEFAMAFQESSTPPLVEEVSKNLSELQTAFFISSDELVSISSEGKALSLQDVCKKPAELESVESTVALPESSTTPLLEGVSKNSSELQTSVFISSDNELGVVPSEGKGLSLQDVSKKPIETETVESTMAFPESSTPPHLEEVTKDSSELQTSVFIPSDNELGVVPSEGKALSLQDVSKKPIETETVESTMAFPESSTPPHLEEVTKDSSELQTSVFMPSDNELAVVPSKGKALSLQDVINKPIETETVESTMAFPERSTPPHLEEVTKDSSELQTSVFIPSDNELAVVPSEGKALSLQDVSKKPIGTETLESTMAFPESSTPPHLEEVTKDSSELQTSVFISSDNELAVVPSEGKALSLQDVSKKSIETENAESTMVISENNIPPLLEEVSKNSSELDNKVIAPLSEDKAFILQDVGKKPTEFETAELAMTLPKRSVPLSEVISKNVPELQTAELIFADSKKLITQLSEDSLPLLERVSKKPLGFEDTEVAMQLPEKNAAPLEEGTNNTSQLETVAFKTLDNKELVTPLPENNYSKGTQAVIDVGVTHGEDINQKPQDLQKMEVQYEIENDLEMEMDVSILGERDIEKEHVKLAACPSDISQGDPESQLLEMQVETHKGKGFVLTEENQMNDSSKLTVSAWVSDVRVQSQLVLVPINTSKMNEESPQIAETGQDSSKESLVDLQLGNVGFDRLESAFSEEISQASVAQSMDPELKTLNKGESDSFHTDSKEEGLLANVQQKAGEDSDVVHVPESGEMPVDCLVNVTMTSCIQEKHEETSQQSLSCGTKDLHIQGADDLGSISSSNDVELSSEVELIFVKDGTQGPSEPTMEFSEERGSMEKVNFTRVQPVTVQEPLDVLPAEFSVESLGEETLSFTGMNTEVLNTSVAGDFELHTTYSELSFDQSATLSLNLNVENDRDVPKSNDIKPTDPSRLKARLELETIDFSLRDIDVDREHLGILPPEILNEDSVESPKLETIAPVCLEASKTIELGINHPGVESEVIDFAALTSAEQDDKLHPLVSDVADPHIISPAANDGSGETDMPLFKMQYMPPISETLLKTDSKGNTSDMLSLSCGGKSLQSHAAVCVVPFLPDPKETSLEVGGSGDSELCVVKNEIQIHARELIKMEDVESNDGRCEVNRKLASEVTENSAEDLLL